MARIYPRQNMHHPTSTARKIIEVFRCCRIKKDDILSAKLLMSKRHLWREIDGETFTDAIGELMEWGSPRGTEVLGLGAE